VMIGLAFLLLCGRGGWATPLLDAIGWRVPFAFPGLVVATLFVTLPFTARVVGHLLEEIGDAEEQAAATLGASSTRAFLLVTLPNVAPALGTGIVLVVARSLGEFGAVLVLGGAIAGATDTATTFLYQSLEQRREGAVVGASLVLVAVSVLVLAATKRLQAPRRRRR
jgi:sulfate/thiosulfate transport system permease protein